MSHLLASVNREAAERIQPEPERSRLPVVGEMVVYYMRAGHGRNGKTFFPAIVQGHGERGTLALTVIIDAGDLCDESLVEERKVGTEFHCWERPEVGFAEPVFAPMSVDEDARSAIDELGQAVFGDFERPSVSLVGILADFEQRLAAANIAIMELKQEAANVKLRAMKGKGK